MSDYYETFDDFGADIDDAGGILLVDMGTLRDVHGVNKLGVHIRTAIKNELASRGIGTLPELLPTYQHESVRLYRLGSSIAGVIDAVLHPSATGDDNLRRTAGSDAQATLDAIRQLVC
ncbi:hypothetical protein [Nocardia rhizosphaerihabitans]|uniref:Uncharacterized protein n=1 Tax=Nocardia rhizosphaerihabitans TaxID=1691570 RepID=A0ABQ2KR18_9NOCA|nr:hypothetical protein [Nocardia rhizosphaerihabitans]GGN88769.1 hypothetical protein GCM10011610_46560 [Nocardia rhizosphaerihabitans]